MAEPEGNDELFTRALVSARRAENSLIGGPPWKVVALAIVAAQLAKARRWRWAFDVVSEAHFTIDPFLIAVTDWSDALETTAPGLFRAVLAGVAGVFGWQRPDLKALAERIAGESIDAPPDHGVGASAPRAHPTRPPDGSAAAPAQ